MPPGIAPGGCFLWNRVILGKESFKVRLGLRSAFLSGVLLAVAVACGSAQLGGVPLGQRYDPKLEPAQVRELVARYCRTDYVGARLNAADWPKIQPTIAWRENPEYSLFMVISRFDVSQDIGSERNGKYEVLVKYRLLGKFDLAEGYSVDSANQVEDVRFTVSEVNGEWRITDAEPNFPHPSKAAAMQWISRKLSETSDPAGNTIYQDALQRLQAQSGSPLTK